jgi:NTP pyrophosphatase (non-canonical NTP hydrolase)
MDSKLYQQIILRTENKDFDGIQKRFSTEENTRLMHSALGLSTEANEFLDTLKKTIYYGKNLDKVNLIEELGDLLYYTALALDVLGSSFEEAMEVNSKKLQKRYNKGEFTTEAAINRNLKVEREVLENGTKTE